MAHYSFWKQPFHQARRLLAKVPLKFYPQLTIIGVTGSYGKTNTTRAITTVLSQKFESLQTDINLDTVFNLPITILKLRPRHEKLVLEYGVDHKNEMDFHLALVKPSIAVMTGINPTHSDPELLGSIEGIIKEKGKLMASLPKDGWAILNWDDVNVRKMESMTKANVLHYGLSPESDFWASDIEVDFSGTSFVIHHKAEKIPVKTPLIGRHFVYACLAATAVAKIQGLEWQEIVAGLALLKPLKGRLSIEEGPRGTVLINDSLRANPASTLAGLRVLADLPTKGRRIAVLGEMGELGESAKKGHIEVGAQVAKLKIDYLISIGPLQKLTAQKAIADGLKKDHVFWVKDVREAADTLKKILKKGDLLYLKASLLRHIERVLLILEGKKTDCDLMLCNRYQSCRTCPKV